MRFQCDRCGKRYSTSQEIRDGRTYSVKCRSCGHKVIVRAAADAPPATPAATATATATPTSTSTSTATSTATATTPTATPMAAAPTSTPAPVPLPAAGAGARRERDAGPGPAAGGASVVHPWDLPPPDGGYIDLVLDDDPPAPARTPPPTLARTPPPNEAATRPEPLELALEPTGRSGAARAAARSLTEVREGGGVFDEIPVRAARPAPGAAQDDASGVRWRRSVALAVGATVAVTVAALVVSLAGGRRSPPAPLRTAAQAAPIAPADAPGASRAPAAAPEATSPAAPAPGGAEVAVDLAPPERRSDPATAKDLAPARPSRSSGSRTARREEPAVRKASAPARPAASQAHPAVAIADPVLPPAPPQVAPKAAAAAAPPAPAQPSSQVASSGPASPPPAPAPAPVAAPKAAPATAPPATPARADDARSGPDDVARVVLRRDVDGLGRSGEIVEVPPGYARNFLIPRGLAAPAAGKRGRDAQVQRRPGAQGEEEPVFAGAGYRRPVPTTPQCVERNLRLPADAGGQAGTVTLRFAVGRSGVADLLDVQAGPGWPPGRRVEPRLVQALEAAVRGCRFTPGADEQGRPVRLWVVMQIPVSG
jgi:DNA-directed RNA polymerase subunit RPC12/RpoP